MPASTNCRARGGRFSRLDTGGCFLRATRLPVRIPVTLVVVLVLSIKVLVEYTMLPSELAVEAAMGTAGVRLTMEGFVGSVEILVPFLVLFAQLFMDPTVLPVLMSEHRGAVSSNPVRGRTAPIIDFRVECMGWFLSVRFSLKEEHWLSPTGAAASAIVLPASQGEASTELSFPSQCDTACLDQGRYWGGEGAAAGKALC